MDKLNINLNLYRSFYYVAKYGGFTKASSYASISQSSLSSNIKNLEDCLKTKLFERNISNVTLTNEGKELFLKLEKIVNILDESIERKEINIGCIRFIADNYLDKTILEFKQKYKNIKMNFNLGNTIEFFQMLRKNELDIVICRYPLFYKFEKNITVEKIKDVENVFVCSPKFYEKEKMKMKSNKYIFPMILPDSSEKRRSIEQFLIDNNIKYNIEIELPNSILLKKLITNNLGIGYINKKTIQDDLDNKKIIILNNFKNIPQDNITIIYNSEKNNPVLQNFLQIFKNTIKKADN